MDILDHAQNTEELILGLAKAHRREEGPPPTGRCLYCGEEVDPPKRWCDAHCRDDWEKRKRCA